MGDILLLSTFSKKLLVVKMDIDRKENYIAVVDMLENKLVSHINNVYTNFIREVNVCVTTILTTANASADALEDYLKKEVSDLKTALQWTDDVKYEVNDMYDKYLPMSMKMKMPVYKDDKEIAKDAISANLNPKLLQEKAKIDEMLGHMTAQTDDFGQSLTLAPKQEPLSDNPVDDANYEFKGFTFSTEDLNSDTDPLNLTYKQKRALAKERMEYKRQNGLLWRQKRDQAKAMKEIMKASTETEKNGSEYYKPPSGSDPDWVEDEKENAPKLDYKQKRQMQKERMEYKRKNGLLWRQKKEKKLEEKYNKVMAKAETINEAADQIINAKTEIEDTV